MSLADENKTLNAAGDLRAIFGDHAAKKIASAFDRSVATAKLWLSGGVPKSQLPMLWRGMLAELDRQEADKAARRQRIMGDLRAWEGGFTD